MAMNRVQFQKGLSIKEFQENYGTVEKCEEWLENFRWPDGFHCPKCNYTHYCEVWHQNVKTFQCFNCRTQTTLTSGTIFHASKLPLTTWFLAMYLMTQSKNAIAALELMRILGVCYHTAWRLKHKLIQVMSERENGRVLSGRIELDDAYFGGERSGGKVGRGSENKIPFLAAVEADEFGKPHFAVFSLVASFSKHEIKEWSKKRIAKGSVVVSDGLACFRQVQKDGVIHSPRVVGIGKKGTSLECFKWVNTILGNLKNSITGTYHSVKFGKYAARYLAEFQYRFNRRFKLNEILTRLIVVCAKTGPRPESFLRMAEASC